MIKLKYAVIILNYNTISDSITAAESVINNATRRDFLIVIADNASTLTNDRSRLNEIKNEKIIVTQLRDNNGYAAGNNKAIEFLNKQYKCEYIVIMNPDVLIIKKGTIERLINGIEAQGISIIGGQPLVWNCHYPGNARNQINIRRVPNYFMLCIISNVILRAIFYCKFKEFAYLSRRPYTNEIIYEVPSGAFFVIKTEIFIDIDGFDTGTFLYNEEYCLGAKVKKYNGEFLFMPSEIVRHEHGKSTGNNRYNVKKEAYKKLIESTCYYGKTYLHLKKYKIAILEVLLIIDYIIRKTISYFKYFRKG